MGVGQRNHQVGDILLVPFCGPGELLDDAAIAIARVKVHARVNVRRIAAQDGIDLADGLKKRHPILGGQRAQAGDAIGHHRFVAVAVAVARLARDGWQFVVRANLDVGQPGERLRQALQDGLAQHEGQSPQFARGQRSDILVSELSSAALHPDQPGRWRAQ